MEAIATPFWFIGKLELQEARVNRMPTVHKGAVTVAGFSSLTVCRISSILAKPTREYHNVTE